ncbi:hypothetical protein BGX29_003744 [Mortierella sp. GBA35]|nr:hypothetical protein BGX29_003744 [Mortierella sp. GBA35]
MQFTTLSKATLAIFAASLILLLTQQANAHSYADCIDYHFKDPKNPSWSDKNGARFGYARRFPLKVKPFAKLDSDGPNRHYQQSHKDPDPNHSLACSDGKQGEEPGADETMGNPISAAYNGKDKRGRKTGVQTVSYPGGELCIRWPAKNHAVPNEKTQSNCSDTKLNTDIWPCGGCFKLPTNLKPGNVVMQWRWKLNSNEWYTSCADINVKASSITTPIVGIPSNTISASHALTSATDTSPTITSASHTPTSVTDTSPTTTSTSHIPTSATDASPTTTSASHTPTSATDTSPTTISASPTINSTVGSPPIIALALGAL